MQIYCRHCGEEIQAENINLDKMIAKCDQCNAVFSFADMYEGVHEKRKSHFELEDIPTPKGITIYDAGDYLNIERKWLSCTTYVLIPFAIFWNGMIWGIFVPGFAGIETFSTLFLLPFIAVGLGLALYAIAGLVNKTIVHVDSEALTLKHEPLPFPGKRLHVNDIDQLYTRQRVSHSKNGTNVSYELRVVTADGGQGLLLRGLENAEHALYIEQEVERFLGIENRPVRGEYR